MNPPAAPNPPELSIVLPAKNEQAAVGQTVEKILRAWPEAEVIVVNDGSSDNTAQVATAAGARVVSQPYSMGNGAAIKTGARAALGGLLLAICHIETLGRDIAVLIQRIHVLGHGGAAGIAHAA